MPIYEYRCNGCAEVFSVLQKMSTEAGETVCPKCGTTDVTRQISACSIGSGSTGVGGPPCSIGGG